MYQISQAYTRAQIYELLNVPEDLRGGDWATGYHRHGDDLYVFCNVGGPGRTGHDYRNHWDGETLVWYGKPNTTFDQSTIKAVISGALRPLIFYRTNDRSAFTFAGIGKPVPHLSIVKPVRIDWLFAGDDMQAGPSNTDEYAPGSKYEEGHRTKVYVNRYERDRDARDACVALHGTACAVCGFSFHAKYGELGEGYIHVHHRTPISDLGRSYIVDPSTDLIPVCPNCHAMLHRRNPPLGLEELRRLVAETER